MFKLSKSLFQIFIKVFVNLSYNADPRLEIVSEEGNLKGENRLFSSYELYLDQRAWKSLRTPEILRN